MVNPFFLGLFGPLLDTWMSVMDHEMDMFCDHPLVVNYHALGIKKSPCKQVGHEIYL